MFSSCVEEWHRRKSATVSLFEFLDRLVISFNPRYCSFFHHFLVKGFFIKNQALVKRNLFSKYWFAHLSGTVCCFSYLSKNFEESIQEDRRDLCGNEKLVVSVFELFLFFVSAFLSHLCFSSNIYIQKIRSKLFLLQRIVL